MWIVAHRLTGSSGWSLPTHHVWKATETSGVGASFKSVDEP